MADSRPTPSGATAAAAPTAAEARALTPAQAEDPTIGRLVADASRDISSLIQNEIALAKSELKVSAKFGGMGLALFAVAGFLAVLAIIMLSVAFAYFIHMTGLHLAWSFLIVFGAYILIAAILGFVGVKKVKKVRAPERAIHQAQETKTIFKRN
jgi:amino acid transporter